MYQNRRPEQNVPTFPLLVPTKDHLTSQTQARLPNIQTNNLSLRTNGLARRAVTFVGTAAVISIQLASLKNTVAPHKGRDPHD